MDASLFVISDEQKGARYPIELERDTIGRGATNHIVATGPRAARVHAEVVRDVAHGWYVLRDLASTNGTTSIAPAAARRCSGTGTSFT